MVGGRKSRNGSIHSHVLLKLHLFLLPVRQIVRSEYLSGHDNKEGKERRCFSTRLIRY